MTYRELEGVLNQLAGTNGLGANAAANVWAGTHGLSMIGALNAKAGNAAGRHREFDGVCNQLASTKGWAGVGALNQLAGNSLGAGPPPPVGPVVTGCNPSTIVQATTLITVTYTGTGFTGAIAAGASLDGGANVWYEWDFPTVVNDTTLNFPANFAPGNQTGPLSLAVTLDPEVVVWGPWSSPLLMVTAPTPTVTGCSPASIAHAVNVPVTVTGTGFLTVDPIFLITRDKVEIDQYVRQQILDDNSSTFNSGSMFPAGRQGNYWIGVTAGGVTYWSATPIFTVT
jgi:hypothetical protein